MDVIKWDQRQPDRSVNKFISLLEPSANVPNTLFSPRSEDINLNKKTDLIEPHTVACGNQKGCCWVGSAGCQLSTQPHDCGCPAFCGRLPPLQRHQPELWVQASAVPCCAYGICVCRWKVKQRQDLWGNHTWRAASSPLAGLPHCSRKTNSPCRQESPQHIGVIWWGENILRCANVKQWSFRIKNKQQRTLSLNN